MFMPRSEYSRDEFELLVRALIGLPVAEPWKGDGSAIFLELGALSQAGSEKHRHTRGEACIRVEWDWRVECGKAVLYGSSNSRPEIARGIDTLLGATIQRVSLTGEVPELVVEFSNGHCLRSMVMVADDPQWMVRLPGEQELQIFSEGGRLVSGRDESAAEDKGEGKTMFAAETRAASRWGVPSADPVLGKCIGCAWYVELDGNGPLLDYGVCGFRKSPFDGRVVNRDSGCPVYVGKGAGGE